jgi:hypothetical protein
MLRGVLGCLRIEARPFERQHHLVNRGRADAEVFLHVGFSRRPTVQAGVQVDKRQILALLGRKGFTRATHAGHPIQLGVRASIDKEAGMNLRYRVELSQTERAELTALLNESKLLCSGTSADQAGNWLHAIRDREGAHIRARLGGQVL